jgi:hypothetical protein
MTPEWILAGVAVLGLLGSGLWTVVNLRIENRLLGRIDELKDWCDQRYIQRPSSEISAIRRPFRAEI